MHLFTSWCPQGTSEQQNISTAGEVIFRTDQSTWVVSIYVEDVMVVGFYYFCCLVNFYICQ